MGALKMTSDELTKQLKQFKLEYKTGFQRLNICDLDGNLAFTLPLGATPKDFELKLREYKKEIKKREIKTTTESMQGELL